MVTVALGFVVLLTIVIAMSVGVLLGGKPIKGSCGGMTSLGMDTACDICGGDTKKCEEEQLKNTTAESVGDEAGSSEALAYNAVSAPENKQ